MDESSVFPIEKTPRKTKQPSSTSYGSAFRTEPHSARLYGEIMALSDDEKKRLRQFKAEIEKERQRRSFLIFGNESMATVIA